MSACRFIDGHNIDKLRLEGRELFSSTPSGWRWANRVVIAEECKWRQLSRVGKKADKRGEEKTSSWYGDDVKPYYDDLEVNQKFAAMAEKFPASV